MKMQVLHTGPIHRISAGERAKVQELLDGARERVRELTLTLNTTSVAVMLPAELLVEIFKYAIAGWPQKTVDDLWPGLTVVSADNGGVYGWIVVTHVCSRWRSVALGTPSLWTRIRVDKLDAVRMLLERSANMPLDVEGLIPRQVSKVLSRAWRPVFKQARRIRSLKVNYHYEETTKTAKWLEHKRPDFSNVKEFFLGRSPDDDPELPQIFEGLRHHPSLQILRVHNVALGAMTQLSVARVQHLEMRGNESIGLEFGADLEIWQRLLALLKGLPELRTLRLHNSLPDYPLDQEDHDAHEPTHIQHHPLILDKPVDLPHLILLHALSDSFDPLALLVRNVSISPCAVLRLDVIMDVDECAKVLGSILAAKIAAFRDATPPQPLRTLVLYTFHAGLSKDDSTRISVAGWARKLPLLTEFQHLPSAYPTTFTAEPYLFEVTSRYVIEAEIVENVVLPLPLETVESISLGLDRPRKAEDVVLPDPELIVLAFAHATKVDTLVVKGEWAVSVASALEPREHDGSMLFPGLKTLYLVETDFAAEDTWSFRNVAQLRKRFWRMLAKSLFARVGYGRQLETIFVKRTCDFGAEEMDILKACAREVITDDWHGYDGGILGDVRDSEEATSSEDDEDM
ncbi:hypothetical protein PHLGIDRAFT_241371 [Phlebiopsis gigantea 11061_1 CR5-6]|uniref:Uncharacterized protein n=1 Tax=Phlebiopsis gigantea (strain 11061_1 CR5-6) TaxID=745531 RepID=A0A0C3SBY0_PHLG1|nr:hypothetical protein PHLGIDRAFT_241371 [Phlebiopsis gigantea 11061_1 CR5-6]